MTAHRTVETDAVARRFLRPAFAAVRSATAAVLVAGILAGIATRDARAQAVNPEEPGPLLTSIVPATPGENACFGRKYDAAHLKAHPKQTITAMTFLLRVVRFDKNGDIFFTPSSGPDMRTRYQFAVSVSRRSKKGTLRAAGDCMGDGAACVVDCDGGGVSLGKLDAKAILVTLRENGIRMHGDCDGEGTWVTPGADDKSFRLDPVAAAQCASLNKNELGD
jgi:hypothetical protein